MGGVRGIGLCLECGVESLPWATWCTLRESAAGNGPSPALLSCRRSTVQTVHVIGTVEYCPAWVVRQIDG